MTDTIAFPLFATQGDATPSGHGDILFNRFETISDLPSGPGLYVLMGRDAASAQDRPLGFGHIATDTATQMTREPLFAAAISAGLSGFGVAALPSDADHAALVARLAEATGAPLNKRLDAMRQIERAQERSASIRPGIAAE